MKKRIKRKVAIALVCISILVATGVVTAMQISLDSPASLPSDI